MGHGGGEEECWINPAEYMKFRGMYSIILIIIIIAPSKLSLIFRRISTGQRPGTGPARPGSAELRAGPVRADTSGSSGRSGPVQAAGATGRSGPGHYPCRARAAARTGPCRPLCCPCLSPPRSCTGGGKGCASGAGPSGSGGIFPGGGGRGMPRPRPFPLA